MQHCSALDCSESASREASFIWRSPKKGCLRDSPFSFDAGLHCPIAHYFLVAPTAKALPHELHPPNKRLKIPTAEGSVVAQCLSLKYNVWRIAKRNSGDPPFDTDQRLSSAEAALGWAREARDVGPKRPGVYGLIRDFLLAAGRRDEAMATLAWALLRTSNKGLEQSSLFAEAAPVINFFL